MFRNAEDFCTTSAPESRRARAAALLIELTATPTSLHGHLAARTVGRRTDLPPERRLHGQRKPGR